MRYDLIIPAQAEIKRNRQKITQSSILKFPNDLGNHAVILNFKTYNYSKSNKNNTAVNSGSIILPLPRNIQDSYNINVQSNDVGITGAALLDGKSAFFDQTAEPAKKMGKAFVDGLTSALNTGTYDKDTMLSAANYLKRAGLSYLSHDISTAIDIGTGTYVNPHTTLSFNGMNLKAFEFNWTLSPKNQTESDNLQKIIHHIKRSILPKYDAPVGLGLSDTISFGQGLLRFPDMVDIFFVGIDQKYFLHYKTCMVVQFTADYSPNGNVLMKGSGSDGARPSIITLNMGLREAAIHTKRDYEDGISLE